MGRLTWQIIESTHCYVAANVIATARLVAEQGYLQKPNFPTNPVSCLSIAVMWSIYGHRLSTYGLGFHVHWRVPYHSLLCKGGLLKVSPLLSCMQ